MRRASGSTSERNGKEACSFDEKPFHFDLQANLQIFFLQKGISSHMGNGKKKPDSGHLTHMVVSAKANGGLHMASLETRGSLTLWHRIITILWS